MLKNNPSHQFRNITLYIYIRLSNSVVKRAVGNTLESLVFFFYCLRFISLCNSPVPLLEPAAGKRWRFFLKCSYLCSRRDFSGEVEQISVRSAFKRRSSSSHSLILMYCEIGPRCLTFILGTTSWLIRMIASLAFAYGYFGRGIYFQICREHTY